MGIGNLPHDLIREAVYANFQPGMDVQLVDTAHASNNERILGDAIASFDNEQRKNIDDGSTANALHRRTRGGGGIVSAEELPPIHVVTKVWYTHLGYERTKLSVHDSLKELQSAHSSSASNTKPRQIYVHMLLHWPRCNDDIPWMHCEEEELGLPQSVKELGTAPHLDKENAWKDSWKALEDLYIEHAPKREGKKSVNEPVIASIGVSNFELEDMKALKDLARIPPHIYQGA